MNVLASMRYLVALNEHKHFGRAAQACHITQPALSNAMRVLEREFGVVIIRRGRTFVGLTPEGERVLASAQRMLHEHNLLQQDLKSDEGRVFGPLRLGAVPTALPVLARFAAMLRVRQPGIVPTVISLSSTELESGIDNLSLDLGLGYTERVRERQSTVTVFAQYVEHYFYLHRADKPAATSMKIGGRMKWKDIAQRPLAMLTPEMHNRTIIDTAFATAGAPVKPAIETNSILALALSVVEGDVSTVMPGALVAAVRGYRELEANPLTSPEVRTPIGFMSNAMTQPSRALAEALALAQDKQWLRHAAMHSGLLEG